MLGGQSPDAPFSPDEMDDSHSSDQMRPRDSIPPTENTLEHPETETSDDQQFAAATISLAAPASEADQHSQADQDPKLSSGHSSHLDTSAEMFISAEATGSDSLQHKETESDCPSTEIVDAETPASFHADAAAAGASKQTQSVQDDGPDNKSDLPLALISHRVEARSDSLPPTEGAHPDTEDPLHRLASQEAILVPGSASQPNQQTQAAPAHAQSSGLGSLSGHSVPGAMLTHLAAAAAAMTQLPGDQPQLPGDQPQLPDDQPQLPDDQPQLPGDQPQLPGDQPVTVQGLPICSAELAQASAMMPEPEHQGNRLTDNGQCPSQFVQARSAETELSEREAHFPVVFDQSQSQDGAKRPSPEAAPLADAPSQPAACSQWEAASGCLIVPDSEDPHSSHNVPIAGQHNHSNIISVQSAGKVSSTAAQSPTEAQLSADYGTQAQATGTDPAPAVAQGSQDAARLQCLRQQTVVGAGCSAAANFPPAQTAGEASQPTSLAQSEEQLAAEHCADGVVADSLSMPLPAEGSQHTNRLHSDREAVPEHVAPPSALHMPAVDPAEELQQQHAVPSAQALKHVAAPLKTQSQLTFQADAVPEGPDRQQQHQQAAAEAAEHTTAPQSTPSLWLHHQDAESRSDQQQQPPLAKVTEHAAPERSVLLHQQEAECEGSDQHQQQQQQQELVKSAVAD